MRLLLLGLASVAFAPAVAAPGPAQPPRIIDPSNDVLSAVPTIDPATGQPVKCRNASRAICRPGRLGAG